MFPAIQCHSVLSQNAARLHREKSLADSTISELRQKVQRLEVSDFLPRSICWNEQSLGFHRETKKGEHSNVVERNKQHHSSVAFI